MRDRDGNVKLADFGSAKQICSVNILLPMLIDYTTATTTTFHRL